MQLKSLQWFRLHYMNLKWTVESILSQCARLVTFKFLMYNHYVLESSYYSQKKMNGWYFRYGPDKFSLLKILNPQMSIIIVQ